MKKIINILKGTWPAVVIGFVAIGSVAFFTTGCSGWKFWEHKPTKAKIIEKVVPQKVLDSDIGDVVEGISDMWLPEAVGDMADDLIDGIYDETFRDMLLKQEKEPPLPPIRKKKE